MASEKNQALKEWGKNCSVEQCWAHCLIYFWPQSLGQHLIVLKANSGLLCAMEFIVRKGIIYKL